LLKIGLTGGAATGKSTVSSILKRLGAEIIDVDMTARKVVEKGSPCLEKIVMHFGQDVLLADGSLNRKKLGDMVFADKAKLEKLNAIVHPVMAARVRETIRAIENKKSTEVLIIDAAILIEMGLHKMADCVWLVWADRKTQIERLVARDGMSEEKAENIIDSQMPMEEKIKLADAVIDNTGTPEALENKIIKLWAIKINILHTRMNK
jgi:dephospho-CoA kinase